MKKLILSLSIFTYIVSLFTVEADRIYTVCLYDHGTRYVFDGSGDFYQVGENERLIPSLNPTLQPIPMLQLIPVEYPINLTQELPGLYHGSLRSVQGLVYQLQQVGATYEVVYASPTQLEAYVTLPEYQVRVIYNISGEIRIYCSESSNAVYLNDLLEGGKDEEARH